MAEWHQSNRESFKMRTKSSLEGKSGAMREISHIMRMLQEDCVNGSMRLPIAIPVVSAACLSYLRMRLAFTLGDEILTGVAFASHATVLAYGGFKDSAQEYTMLAKALPSAKKSDFLRANIMASETTQGLWSNLGTLNVAIELVPLARQLQMKVLLGQQMATRCFLSFNAGNFRVAHRAVKEYYAYGLEEMTYTQLGRATFMRVAVLCVLNQATKAVDVAQYILRIEQGVMKVLGYDEHMAPMHALSLYRSGREEDANDVMHSAMNEVRARHVTPWCMPGMHSILCLVTEMLDRSQKLRKKSKMSRLSLMLDEIMRYLRKQSLEIVVNSPFLFYWEGMRHLCGRDQMKAFECFDRCLSSSATQGYTKYPAVLSNGRFNRLPSPFLASRNNRTNTTFTSILQCNAPAFVEHLFRNKLLLKS